MGEKYTFSRIIKILKEGNQFSIDFASGRKSRISANSKVGTALSKLMSGNNYLFVKMIVSLQILSASLTINKITFISVDAKTNAKYEISFKVEDMPETVLLKIWSIILEGCDVEMVVHGNNNTVIRR